MKRKEDDGPFPKSIFPTSVFPRRIFPWMGGDDEKKDAPNIERKKTSVDDKKDEYLP